MSCSDCPIIVVETVAFTVRQVLAQVQALKALVDGYNSLLSAIADKIVDDLNGLVDLIPDPPLLDLPDIAAYLTCPLTPLAVANVLIAGDPRTIAMELRRLASRANISIQADYLVSLRELTSSELVFIVQRFVREVYRVVGDITTFTRRYPLALANCAYVRVACPTTYEDPRYPFKALVEELTNWSFNGVLPSGIDPKAEAVCGLVARAELKLVAWREAGTVIV